MSGLQRKEKEENRRKKQNEFKRKNNGPLSCTRGDCADLRVWHCYVDNTNSRQRLEMRCTSATNAEMKFLVKPEGNGQTREAKRRKPATNSLRVFFIWCSPNTAPRGFKYDFERNRKDRRKIGNETKPNIQSFHLSRVSPPPTSLTLSALKCRCVMIRHSRPLLHFCLCLRDHFRH